MTDLPPPPALEALLAEESFLRAIARDLLGDAAHADDVVQQAYVAALRRPPRPETVRGWLRTVVRRLAVRTRRAEAARRQREQVVARPEAGPSTEELLERETTRRELLDVLLGLPEKYRQVLLLRFYEAQPPREIARRLGISNGTVRSQISRGLGLMREQLDRRHGGDGRSWCLALIPLATSGGRTAAAVGATGLTGSLIALGGLLMNKTGIILGTTLVLLLGTATLWRDLWESDEPVDIVSSAGRLPPGETGKPLVPETETERVPIPAAAAAAAAAGDRDARPATGVAGRLLAANDTPLPGIHYWVETVQELPEKSGVGWGRRRSLPAPPSQTRQTGPDGSFAWRGPLSPSSPTLLWFQLTPNGRAGYDLGDLPEDGLLRAPAIAPIRVSCLGIAPDERWRISLSPVARSHDRWEPGDLGVRLKNPADHSPGDPTLLVFGTQEVPATGPATVEVRVFRGIPFLTYVVGEGFHASADEAEEEYGGYVRSAPASLRLGISGRYPVVPFEVYEADGALASKTSLTVQLVLDERRSYTEHLRAPRTLLGRRPLRRGGEYGGVALLEDGELFRVSFKVAVSGTTPPVRLVRGQGTAPIRFRVQGTTPVEQTDLLYLADSSGALQPGPSQRPDFVVLKRGVFRVDQGGMSFFLHAPRHLRGGIVVKKTGEVGDLAWPQAGNNTGELRWRSVRRLPAVRIRDVYQRLIGKTKPARGERVRFEFELQLSRADGKRQWIGADHFVLEVGEELLLDPKREAWPTWQKVVPADVPYRMVFWRHGKDPVEFRAR